MLLNKARLRVSASRNFVSHPFSEPVTSLIVQPYAYHINGKRGCVVGIRGELFPGGEAYLKYLGFGIAIRLRREDRTMS